MSITRVDDRSSSITYAGGWGRGGATIDYNGSVSYATIGGQTATLSFRGTGISVYGHIMAVSPGIPPPVSTYSIDGGALTTYNEVQDGTEHPNQQFYQSPVLPNGQHTIVLTYSFDNHAALFLDYFQIVVGSDPPAPAPPSPTPTPAQTVTTVVTSVSSRSSTTTGSPPTLTTIINSNSTPRNISTTTSMVNGTIVTVTVVPSGPTLESNSQSTPPSSSMASNANSTSSSSKINTGIIIGSCVGGVFIIVLAAVLIYCCLRRRRRNEYDWRNVSGFSNQPYSSEWQQQAGRLQGKVSRSHTTTTTTTDLDHSTFSGRPPSYSQEPPLYHPPLAPSSSSSSSQSPLPSKLAGFL